jgi:hypothetical protein
MRQLLKGFVGTGILFMAKAFFNGGKLQIDPDDHQLTFQDYCSLPWSWSVSLVSRSGRSYSSCKPTWLSQAVSEVSFLAICSHNKAEILRYGRSSVRKVYENLDPRFSHRVPDRIRMR